jgi:hypothetical protein
MSDEIKTYSGGLALGPVRHGSNFAVYNHLRIKNDHLQYAKIPCSLNTRIREGLQYKLYVAEMKIPTPFFFSSKANFVFAIEDQEGRLYDYTADTCAAWRRNKYWQIGALYVATVVMFLAWPLALAFLINAIRLGFTFLPEDEMRLAMIHAERAGEPPAAAATA